MFKGVTPCSNLLFLSSLLLFPLCFLQFFTSTTLSTDFDYPNFDESCYDVPEIEINSSFSDDDLYNDSPIITNRDILDVNEIFGGYTAREILFQRNQNQLFC